MTTNWLDRTISWFSPALGYRRAAMRNALRFMAEYEGARTGRRANSWRATGASANAEIGVGLAKLRDRTRELIRNHYFAANAAEKWVTRIIGTGVTTLFDDAQVQAIWEAWQERCSADGLPHFGAVQKLVCRAVFESGECLVRFRMRDRSESITPPFQLQVLEADYLDLDKTEQTQTGYIIQGVQFNKLGKREGYWLFGQHPGDVVLTGARGGLGYRSAFVPASQILHVYEQTRPGQVRGVPRLAPVIQPLQDMADWEDAELLRKRTEACLAGIITSPEGNAFALGTQTTDEQSRTIEEFSPGMIAKLKPGESIEFNTPAYAGGYAEYKASRQRDAAAGGNIPFELVTGNYSLSNYSSSRMGAVSFQETVAEQQWNVYIPMLCLPVAAEFARLLGLFDGIVVSEPSFTPVPFRLLDRQAEGKADQIELQMGGQSWDEYISARGWDPAKHIERIMARRGELEAAGVSFFGSQPQENQNEPQQAQNAL